MVNGAVLRFHYHCSIAPMMWVLVALSSLELVVVHFLLALWQPWVAVTASILTLASIVWIVRLILSFRRLPVLIEGDELVMRAGWLREHRVPLGRIAGLRDTWTADELKQRHVSNLALIAYPNVWLDLDQAVPGRRASITAIAHKLDDPASFRLAVQTRCSVRPFAE